jgi:phospholipid N-methyltransferase
MLDSGFRVSKFGIRNPKSEIKAMSRIEFLKEGIRNLKTVGTFTRSSSSVCKAMVGKVDFSSARTIVELGAGDGVITYHILRAMRPDAQLLAFEIHPAFAEKLRQIDDPRLIVIEDSAEKLKHYLQQSNCKEVDAVISALPFVNFPKADALSIISTCKENLKEGGRYVQIHYSLLARKLYQTVFGNVSIHFVLRNIPPAFVLVSDV